MALLSDFREKGVGGDSKSCDTFDMLGGNPRIHVQYVHFQHMLTEKLAVLDD